MSKKYTVIELESKLSKAKKQQQTIYKEHSRGIMNRATFLEQNRLISITVNHIKNMIKELPCV